MCSLFPLICPSRFVGNDAGACPKLLVLAKFLQTRLRCRTVSVTLMTLPWYALQVKANREWAVTASLESRGCEASCPSFQEERQWSDRKKLVEIPLFRGYVFARFDASNPLDVLTCPGICRIVGVGNQPSPIADEEIETVLAISQSVLARRPVDYVGIGKRVIISRGPLQGSRGLLVRIKNVDRFVVSITLLQRSVMVEIPATWIEPAVEEYWVGGAVSLRGLRA